MRQDHAPAPHRGPPRPSAGRVVIPARISRICPRHARERFRGRHIGIVLQQLHLLPTLTALQEPLGGAGRRRTLDDDSAAAVALLLLNATKQHGASLVIATHDGKLKARIPNVLPLSLRGVAAAAA